MRDVKNLWDDAMLLMSVLSFEPQLRSFGRNPYRVVSYGCRLSVLMEIVNHSRASQSTAARVSRLVGRSTRDLAGGKKSVADFCGPLFSSRFSPLFRRILLLTNSNRERSWGDLSTRRSAPCPSSTGQVACMLHTKPQPRGYAYTVWLHVEP